MKKHYIDLPALYASLEPAEKRSLHIQMDQMKDRGQGLIEIVRHLKDYTGSGESQFVSQLKQTRPELAKSFAANRPILFQLIFEVLYQSQQNQDPLLQIYQLLAEARILRNKTFILPALRVLAQAIAIAAEQEEHEILTHLQQQYLILMNDQFLGKGSERVPNLTIDADQTIAEVNQSHALRKNVSELASLTRHRNLSPEDFADLRIRRFTTETLLQNENLTFRPKAYALSYLGIVCSILGDHSAALYARKALHTHFETRRIIPTLWMGTYSGNLYNLVGSLTSLGDWDEAAYYLNLLDQMHQKRASGPNTYAHKYHAGRTLHLKMLFYLQSQQLEKGIQAYETSPSFRIAGLEELALSLEFAASIFYFEAGQNTKAKAVIRKAMEQFPPQLRKDLRSIMKVMEILILIREDEGEYIQYKLNNLQHQLKNAKGLIKLWVQLAKTATQLYFNPTTSNRTKIWQAFQQQRQKEINLWQKDLVYPRGLNWVEILFFKKKVQA